MLDSVILIVTIAAILGLALILSLIADRLKLPALVGYLLAGILVGRTRLVSSPTWSFRSSSPKSA